MRTANVCFCLALALNSVLVTTPGFAQLPGNEPAPGNDVVVLKSGGMVRGVLIELLPGDHATIQLPTGQNTIVRWSEIHHVERAGSVVATTPVPAPGPGTAPAPVPATKAPPPISGPTVLVHIESPRAVNLYRMSADGNIACVSPCDIQLPLGEEYRIGGTGIHQSDEFRLEGQPGQRVIIRVDPGLRGSVFLGAILAGTGLIAGIAGIYTFIIGAAVNAVDSVGKSTSSGPNGGEIAGIVLMVGGVGMIVLGGVLAIPNLSTSQTQEAQSKVSGMYRPTILREAAPSVREVGVLDRGPARMVSVPIFSTTF